MAPSVARSTTVVKTASVSRHRRAPSSAVPEHPASRFQTANLARIAPVVRSAQRELAVDGTCAWAHEGGILGWGISERALFGRQVASGN